MFSKCAQRLFANSKNFAKEISSAKCRSETSSFRTFNGRSVSLGFCILGSVTAGSILYLSCRNTVFGRSLDQDLEAASLKIDYKPVIEHCRDLIIRLKDEVGIPGVVIGVSVDGKTVWEEGFGYADIENRVLCHPGTVMRIASISKSITMAAVAKLYEDGKIDLDKPVQFYVPDFPKKTFNNVPVEITCRQLVSHLSGIRHYRTKNPQTDSNLKKADEKNPQPKKVGANNSTNSEYLFEEYYIKDKFLDVHSSLDLFKDDPLVNKPGTKYHYSTFAWTLVSAIVEKAAEEKFTFHMEKLFKTLGMHHTYLEDYEPIIYHRSRNYTKNSKKHIVNSRYVDNSYKWAGGGFISTVGDLLKFANAMLYSLQYKPQAPTVPKNPTTNSNQTNSKQLPTNNPDSSVKKDVEKQPESKNTPISETEVTKKFPGYLKSKTLQLIWKPVINSTKEFFYAMGWLVLPEKQTCEYCDIQRFSVIHTGGAIGASSVLVILPKECQVSDPIQCQYADPPKGVSVAIIGNMQEVSFLRTALEIADLFEKTSLNI